MIGFVNRYVNLAGRNCCSGKSWAALDRTLERHACELDDEAPAGTDEQPAHYFSVDREQPEATPARDEVRA